MRSAVALLAFIIAMLVAVYFVTVDQSENSNTPQSIEAPIDSVQAASSQNNAAGALNLAAIRGKSPDEVAAILGQPTSTEETAHGPKMSYQNGSVEITYLGSQADWVTFVPKKGTPFGKESLQELGLSAAEPKVSNSVVMRWENVENIRSINLISNEDSTAGYFAIRLQTETPGMEYEMVAPEKR